MKSMLVLIGMSVWLHGCAFNKVKIAEPTTVRPQQPAIAPATTGGIFQMANFRPLFEDRRARFVGDTLVIVINEKTSASNATSNSNSRTANASFGVPTILGLPLRALQGTSLSANADSKSDDKDAAKNDNIFTGTIAATVTQVLANGNLLVAGEKQVGVNGETDTLRFSGVINPSTIQPGNTVSSTQVADARIETVSRSNIDGAKIAGFIARFFMSFNPLR
jgi:flagellar L-ring protein precursor FlgH